MTAAARTVAPVPADVFAAAMAELVCRPAVVTARRPDGTPCGLLVSSLCSYSLRPPSVLVAIDRAGRSHGVLAGCGRFGVHLLGAGQAALARSFAAGGVDRFAGPLWRWEGAVPRLTEAPVFLDCAPTAALDHGDHTVLIGEVTRVEARPGAPLVHHRRGLDWQLRPGGAAPRPGRPRGGSEPA